RAGTPNVHASRRCSHVAQLLAHPSGHQRFKFLLVCRGIILSAHRARNHVPANGLADPTGLAVRHIDRPLAAQYLGRPLDLHPPLPRRNPDVWQTGDSTRTPALASILLSGAEQCLSLIALESPK